MTSLRLNANIYLQCENDEVIDRAIQDNTFKNPVYISNEQQDRSNWRTPEFIELYRRERPLLVLPRGYVTDLSEIICSLEIQPQLIDERITKEVEFQHKLSNISFRPYQIRAIKQALVFDQGCIVAPTGSGKTLIGLELIRSRGQKSLVIVHRQELATQWIQRIRDHLNLEAGFIGSGEWKIGEQITVGIIQTLASNENELNAISSQFGLVLTDEVHHVPADTFARVLAALPAKFRYGLSATPQRRDGLEQLIYRHVGPILEEIHREEVEQIGATVPATVRTIDTGFKPCCANSWHEYLSAAASNADRNSIIINLAISQTAPVLILTDRVAHAENLSDMFSRRNINHILAHGQLKDLSEVLEKAKESKITIGTTSLIGEGVDISSWGVLIMASPFSSETKLMQAIGRIVRPAPKKEKAIVYDLKDDCGFSGASFKKRFEVYKKHKIWVEFSRKQSGY